MFVSAKVIPKRTDHYFLHSEKREIRVVDRRSVFCSIKDGKPEKNPHSTEFTRNIALKDEIPASQRPRNPSAKQKFREILKEEETNCYRKGWRKYGDW